MGAPGRGVINRQVLHTALLIFLAELEVLYTALLIFPAELEDISLRSQDIRSISYIFSAHRDIISISYILLIHHEFSRYF